MSTQNLGPPTWQAKLGEQIRKARKDRKYPSGKLADVLGVCRETLRLYETGEVPPPLPALRTIVRELEATFLIDGITISASSLPPALPREVPEQTNIDFRGDYSYVGVTVRMSVSKEGFILKGQVPPKAVNS